MITLTRTKKIALIITVIVLITLILTLSLYFGLQSKEPYHGAIATNGAECSKIGVSILQKGGSAIDAAIAALFCEGIAMPQSMGLGGGFLMTIYTKSTNTVRTLNAREVAPSQATEDMFDNDPESYKKGGLAAAVPGELRGYIEAHKYGGKLPWRELVQPTIELCRQGVIVTDYVANLLKNERAQITKDPGLKEVLINPRTNEPWLVKDKIKWEKLGRTLEVIAEEPDALHNGSLTANFVRDVVNKGGILQEEDMRSYKPKWQVPIRVNLPSGDSLFAPPLPGSGVILGFILNIVKDILNFNEPYNLDNYQRTIESFKFGYGKRSELGDLQTPEMEELIANLTSEEYAKSLRPLIFDNTTNSNASYYGGVALQPEDHGTAHISVLAPNGDAVSVTSTINLYYGAGFASDSTGIILNNQMNDFSVKSFKNEFDVPPSPNNYIAPGKHPLSSMCPSIVTDARGVKLVVGGAGGTKITTSVAWVIMRHLWFNFGLEDAIYEQRFHHQLYPMILTLEERYANDTNFVDTMRRIGHVLEFKNSNGFSAITAVSNKNGIQASWDFRRKGSKSFI